MSSMINEDAARTKPEAQPPLYFHCSVCGECCSSWNIPIEGEKARALLEKDWVKKRLNAHRRELVRVHDDLYRLPLTDENVCVFLGEDKRCLIEVHEGLALKPRECQRFPFAAVKLPDGSMRHDTSAACKQVAEKLLLAFQPVLPRPDDTAIPVLASDHEVMPARFRIGLVSSLDGSGYARYQQRLREIFAEPDIHPETLLFRVRNMLASLKEEKPQVFEETFLFKPLWQRWLPVLFLRKPYDTWSWFCLIRGTTYDDPRVFGLPVDLAEVSRPDWSPALNRPMNAFLFSLLNRKVLLARGASLEGVLALSVAAYFLALWYARVLAAMQERDAIGQDDLSMAIRLVERYYSGHQPRFLKFFVSGLKSRGFLALLF